jgi:hypothetical protein
MFVLIAWVMQVIIRPMPACRTPGFVFILPVVRSLAHPIPDVVQTWSVWI